MKFTTGDPTIDTDNFWVFGYASLMWRPGFVFAEVRPAVLPGYRRDMCFLSIHYRGTAEVPGLICGLLPATGECKGRAYRISPEHVEQTVRYLDERELITDIYFPQHLEIRLDGGRRVIARTYVGDTAHAQFVGRWPDEDKAQAIVRGVGSEGRSLEYLANIVSHLSALDIDDVHLTELLEKAQALNAVNGT